MAIPTNFSTRESLECIWAALHTYREDSIPTRTVVDRRAIQRGETMQVDDYEEEWDDICTAMAWITEALGHETT